MAQQISMAELGTLANTYDAIRNAEFFYKVDFTAMNNSEVSGGAFLALDTDSNILTVLTAATGVEANAPHPQHLHGFLPGEDGSVQNSMVPGIRTVTASSSLARGSPPMAAFFSPSPRQRAVRSRIFRPRPSAISPSPRAMISTS